MEDELMSTTPLDSWAVDLADVTFIYPFVGSEKIMVVILVVLWIAWHIWQVKFEKYVRKFEPELGAQQGPPSHNN
jgi:hypothetical protein